MLLFDVLFYASSAVVFAGCCIWLVVAAYIWRSPAPIVAGSGPSSGSPASAASDKGRSSNSHPSIAVVMPVKGMHAHSQTNWTAHIESTYPGNIVFVFVVEDECDGAYSSLCALRDSVERNRNASADGPSRRRSIVVACAGYAFHCSQKIYNMVKGLHCTAPESEYILFLDDDVAIYPHTIQTLLDMLSSDPALLMVTGWPYDVLPLNNMPVACLCRIVYRWFSMFPLTKQRVPCVWGGCMMFRAADLKSDAFSLVSNWLEGGYSDDMIVGALCERHGRGIGWATALLFPSRCSADDSLPRFLSFIQRQMFVLRTYRSLTERWVNMFIMWITSSTSATLGFNLIASVYILLSHFRNSMFSMPSAANETGASTQVAVATACLLLLYASVYTLHFVCVAHISRISAPPAQTMHTPSPIPLFLAFLCVCAAVPVGAICAPCRSSIVWSGIRYSIKDGGVCSVVRSDGSTKSSSKALRESK